LRRAQPDTNTPYDRDPRASQDGLELRQVHGIGDTVFFGPEAEFFVFDDVRWSTSPENTAIPTTPPNCGEQQQGL